MSQDPRAPAQPADDLTKTSAGNSIELTEEELKRVAGGAGAINQKLGGVAGEAKTTGKEKWIELISTQW